MKASLPSPGTSAAPKSAAPAAASAQEVRRANILRRRFLFASTLLIPTAAAAVLVGILDVVLGLVLVRLAFRHGFQILHDRELADTLFAVVLVSFIGIPPYVIVSRWRRSLSRELDAVVPGEASDFQRRYG